MSAEDAWYIYFETAQAPLHIGSIAIYEGAVPFDKVCKNLDDRIHLIPRYRQRVVIPPLFAGHPTWEDDQEFSIDRHLRIIDLPAPGSQQQLIALSSEIFARMLPRDRPLWDITVIRGMEDGNTAYVSRVHHCLVDGVSGIELLMAVLDLVPEPEPTPPPAERWAPKALPDPVSSWVDAAFEQWDTSVRAFGEWQRDMLLEPRAGMRRFTDLARAFEIALPASMRRAPQTPWNKSITGARTFALNSMSFQEVRAIRSVLGGTVNDVVLTVLGGALGRYLQLHGIDVADKALRIMIPVNVRKEDEKGNLGNRVSMMFPDIPAGISDPAARLQAVRAETERVKSVDQASAFERISKLSENAPALFHALAGMGGVPGGTANLVCTNVPGPLIPLYSAGHRMLAHYPLVPIMGDLGIGVGVTSYDRDIYFGIMADPTIVSDLDAIRGYIAEEFEALRAAAGVRPSDLPAIGVSSNGKNGHAEAVKIPEELAAASRSGETVSTN